MGILTEQRAGSFFRSESSSGLIFYFQTSGRVFFSSPRSRKPEDAAPGRRTCYCPGLFSCPVRNTHHGGGGSLAADLYICIIYVTRGRGAKSARRCAVDHCVSSVSIFIYLFALLRARPPSYHDAAPGPHTPSPRVIYLFI